MVKKYTKEMKIKACKDFLEGKKSRKQIALELHMGKKGDERIREWCRMYELNGSLAFNDDNKHRRYTEDFKIVVVNDYISSGLSELSITAKYNLSSCGILREWISKYNKGEKFKTIINNPEVYNMPRLKTTKEEKLKIVQFCLDHNSNYALTAQEYGISYHQVYEWCKKYKLNGESALDDIKITRYNTSTVNTSSKNEKKLKSQIKKLEHRNLQLEREIEVLKKAYALEMELFQFQGIKKKKQKE